MKKMKLFASILVVGSLIVFIGCSKNEDDNQEIPVTEAEQQSAVPSVESTAPTEHEVVVIVRAFLKAIDGGDYDQAIAMGTPDEFKREGLIQVNEAFDFANIDITEALVGDEQAAVLIGSIPGPSGTGQFGYSLVKNDNSWLIRDVDWLPRTEAVEKWLTGFKSVEPNAKRVSGEES
ncbi:hypothetical protein ACFL6U_31770 [Planctomycetota bacterium]